MVFKVNVKVLIDPNFSINTSVDQDMFVSVLFSDQETSIIFFDLSLYHYNTTDYYITVLSTVVSYSVVSVTKS